MKNNIYLWSKTYTREQMRIFCLGFKLNLDLKEKCEKILTLRKQKKPFKEISELTGVPIEQMSFFLTLDPNKVWTLDDWIKGYLEKDSSVYQKADFVIDPDPKFVHRFQSKGIDGNVIEKL